MVFAIIHSATRLVYGLTTDDPPPSVPNAEAVAVPDGANLAGGPYVLTGAGVLVRATEQQVRTAFAGSGYEDAMVAAWAANGA